MPARSTGCFQCRKRKVRCDEGRPGCERCAKHGVPCPGYRREKGVFEFEDQTVSTARKAKESYGDKSALVLKRSSKASSLRSTPEVLPSDLERRAFQTWSLILPPTMIASPAANKAQLYDKWLEIYVPVTNGNQGLHFDFLRTAIGMAETEPALRDGLNTLALVQVGHAANDERLLAASVPSYGKALASLARAVSKATSVRDDTVLAAANLLVIAEFYDKIKTEGFGWGGHVLGVEQLLLARGPDSLDTELSLSLFCNARHSSASWCFLLRKANPYDTPAWRAAAFRAPVNDSSLRLFDASIRVPRLLQRSDELDPSSPNGLDLVTNLLYECESLETELRDWLRDFHITLRQQGLEPFTIASVEDFKTFASHVADRTLPTCYRFNDFMSGYLHSQYWISMHYLRTTIKDLREQRQSLDPYFQPDFSRAVTEEELSGYTFDLCRLIPHFVEPESGTQGHIGIFLPLAVILMYFRSRQNWKWCLWALNVKENVFHMGLRQPRVEEKDLPVAVARPRAGLSPFPNDEPSHVDFLAPTRVSAKNELSLFPNDEPSQDDILAPTQVNTKNKFSVSPSSWEDVGLLVDDYTDVDLNIDWSVQTPGFATAVQGRPQENAASDVLDLHDDFVYYDSSLSPEDYQLT